MSFVSELVFIYFTFFFTVIGFIKWSEILFSKYDFFFLSETSTYTIHPISQSTRLAKLSNCLTVYLMEALWLFSVCILNFVMWCWHNDYGICKITSPVFLDKHTIMIIFCSLSTFYCISYLKPLRLCEITLINDFTKTYQQLHYICISLFSLSTWCWNDVIWNYSCGFW